MQWHQGSGQGQRSYWIQGESLRHRVTAQPLRDVGHDTARLGRLRARKDGPLLATTIAGGL